MNSQTPKAPPSPSTRPAALTVKSVGNAAKPRSGAFGASARKQAGR